MGFGIQSSGGSGEGGNWSELNTTTHATPNSITTTTHSQVVAMINIINDGTADILFSFDKTDMSAYFTVKVGESRSFFQIHKTLSYKSATASVPFRAFIQW